MSCVKHLPEEASLSDSCENMVWRYRSDITRKDYFMQQALEFCPEDFISECQDEKKEPGFLLDCLVKRMEETESPQCGEFVSWVSESVSDCLLISLPTLRWRTSSSLTTGSP